jgi:hypothetical protein
VAPLNEAQTAAARQEAQAMHREMNRHRQAMGHAPFPDGVPEDVLALSQRLLAFHVDPLIQELGSAASSARGATGPRPSH